MKWEQQCKIIHVCTRKYMTVKDGQVTLTSDHLDPATVFRLHPVIRVIASIAVRCSMPFEFILYIGYRIQIFHEILLHVSWKTNGFL